MTIDKLLQVIGLLSCLFGASFLSIDVFGRDTVYKFAHAWIVRLRNNRATLSMLIGITIGVFAVLNIDRWKTQLIDYIIPLMLNTPVISIFISTLITLALVLFIIKGKTGLVQLSKQITTNIVGFYDVLVNPKRWEASLKRFSVRTVSYFGKLIHSSDRIRILMNLVSYFTGAFFGLILLAFPLVYLSTGNLGFWYITISIHLPIIITFILIGVGYPVVEFSLLIFKLTIRGDIKGTFSALGKIGFVLLALGSTLQVLGVWAWWV